MQKLPLTENELRLIILEVRKYFCIWDRNHDNYDDKEAVAEAWTLISKAVNCDEALVRYKWKLLKDMFKHILQRHNISNIDQYTGNWQYFKLMWFMFDHMTDTNNDCDILMVTTKSNGKFDHDYGKFNELEDIEPSSEKNGKDIEDYGDLVFFKSLIPYFRELEPIRRLVVRNKIQDMLLNEVAPQKMS